MKQQITYILLALTIIIGHASAQSLSILNIEVQKSGQTELVVSLSGASDMTALQFNLQLPDGLTINTNGTTLGTATDGHILNVQTLDNGELLFVLYSMDLKAFKDGELLRIPITAGNTENTFNGQCYKVRAATADAVSHTCEDVPFRVTVSEAYTLGDVNGDGSVSVTDVTMVISHILGLTPEGFNKDAADVNGDKSISVTDVTMMINIILKGGSQPADYYVGWTNGTKSAFAALSDADIINGATGYSSLTTPTYTRAYGNNNIFYLLYQTNKIPQSIVFISNNTRMTQDIVNDNTCPHTDVVIDGVTYKEFGIRLTTGYDPNDSIELNF